MVGSVPIPYPILMLMHEAAVPPFMKNGFVLACERTREAVYIDPGDEVDRLLDVMDRERFDLKQILLTHAHVDHVSGVAQRQALRERARFTCIETICFSTTTPSKHGVLFGLAGRAAATGRSLLRRQHRSPLVTTR